MNESNLPTEIYEKEPMRKNERDNMNEKEPITKKQ